MLYYGQDRVGLKELADDIEVHEANKARFKLPDRVTAKKWLFKTCYGATPYGMAVDPEFAHVSTKEAYWANVLEEFYNKYEGIAAWHRKIVLEAKTTGKLVAPSGRIFHFSAEDSRFGPKWPEPKIKNYPVQGFGADIVGLVRGSIYRRLVPHREKGILLINTVHDSIMVDCKDEQVDFVCGVIKAVFDELPRTISRCFNISFNVKMAVEIEVGNNYRDMRPYGL